MSSVVAEKQFVWSFIDKVTQGVDRAKRAMDSAKDAAKQAGVDVKESSTNWDSYGNQAKEAADKANSAVKQAANTSRDSMEKVKESIDKVKDETEKIPTAKTFNLKAKFDDTQLRTFTRKIKDIPEEKSTWMRIKDGFTNPLRNAQHEANNTQQSFSHLKEIMAGTFVGGAVLNGIYAIGNGMKSLIATGYEYTRQQQTMIASWHTLTGSASEGQKMVDMTNQLAISAQNSTEMVNDLNQKFYAVTNNATKTRELSKSILTLQDAFNASDASIENFSTQWAQMVGNGKASAQDMLSIQNVFPKFRQELLKYERQVHHSKDMSMADMNQLMSDGKIKSSEMNHVLISMGHEYQNATKNFTNTLDGMGRIIRTTAPRLLGAFVEPFTKAQNPIYKAVSSWVSDPRTLKAFQNAGQGIADAFNNATNAIADMVRPFRGLNQLIGEFIKTLAGGVLHGIATDFHLIGDAVEFVLKVINTLLSPINDLTKHLNGIGGAAKPIQNVGTVIGELLGPIVAFKTAAMGVNAVATVFSGTGKAIKAVGGAIKAVTSSEKLLTIAQTALNVVLSPWFLIPAAIAAVGVALYEAYKHIKPFRDAVDRLGKALKNAFTGNAGWEKDLSKQFQALNKAFDRGGKAFQKKMQSLNKSIWNGLTGNAGWEKDLQRAFDNAKKDYDRYSKQQLKAEQMMQRERQKNWNNFWSGLSKKARSSWDDMTKRASSGMQSIGKSIATHSSSLTKTWDNTWSTMKRLTVNAWQVIRQRSSDGMSNVRGAISNGMNSIQRIWNSGWSAFANFFKGIWSGIKQAAADGMNGVINVINAAIGGINKVWSFFTGHGTGLSNIGKVHFAQGGVIHRHLSVINDGDGPDWKELVQTPDGGLYMSQERNWTGFLPEGTRVYSGPETRQIMNAVGVDHYATGGVVGAKHYADGGIISEGIDWAKGTLDNLGSWLGDKFSALEDFLADPLKATKGLIEKATSGLYNNLGHYADLAHGAMDKLTQPIADWFKKGLEKLEAQFESGGASPDLIRAAAAKMHVSISGADISHIMNVIKHESGGNAHAINNWDSNAKKGTPSKGILQFIDPTFRSYAMPGHTNIYSPFDQLLAMFNDTTWRSDLTLGGWGPTGGRRYALGGEVFGLTNAIIGDNPEHHEFVLNPYATSAEPLLDRAFEATANAQPSGQTTPQGNGSKMDRMISLLEALVASVQGLDLNVALDGDSIVKYANKKNAKAYNMMKGR